MNNSLFNDLKFKIFQSGNPSYFYIGLNVLVFLIFGIYNVTLFLFGKNTTETLVLIKEYVAFPSSWVLLPSKFYTLFTYAFFNFNLFTLLFNMLWLFWMGRLFLDFLKPKQFHFVYLAGAIIGALFFSLAFNVFPAFAAVSNIGLTGADAAIMAIMVATATLVPNYSLQLLFFGQVKLKYIVLVYVLINIIGIAQANPVISFAHLGGGILGFVYIKLLQSGTDLSLIFNKKQKLKVTVNPNVKKSNNNVNQQEIDTILDKISKSGYEQLSKEEKQTLFKASKN